MRRATWLLVLMTLASSHEALAQVSTTPQPLAPAFDIHEGYGELQELTRLYNAGDWTALQEQAKALLNATAKAAADEAVRAVYPSKHFIIVTWLGTDVFGKPMLARIVVHGPPRKAGEDDDDDSAPPFQADLPGVGVDDDEAVFEVYFSRGVRGKIAEVYVSTRDKNPLSDQLPAFIQGIAAALFQTVGVLGGTINPPRTAGIIKAGQPSIAATVSRVALPFERATIKWKAVAKEPVDPDDFGSSLTGWAADVKFSDVPHSACAKAFVGDVVDTLRTAAADPHCNADKATAADCKDFVSQELTNALAGKICYPPTENSKDDKADLLTVDKKAREFVVKNLTMSAEAEVTFKNRPLTHWSFGAGSGVMSDASLTKPRVNLKNDKIAADPLPRVMTLTFVNLSAGYDAELDHVSAAERFRPFFGAILTPDYGVAAGLNVLLARGIGVAGGWGVMLGKGARQEAIDKTPADSKKPYEITYERITFFLGISYNVK